VGAERVGAVVLTIDAGNGSLKAALWSRPAAGRDDGAALVGAALANATPLATLRAAWIDADLEARLADLAARASVALVACVAGPRARARLDAALERAGRVDATPDHGLDLSACRRTETIGVDRLWAARAAVALTGGAACLVVDAGTAVTVDAVGPGARFCGGAIALGLAATARALAGEGAGLFAVEVAGVDPAQVPALGRESAEALRAGAVHGVRGAVCELAARVAREAGLADDAPRLVGGGDAGLLLAAPAVVPRAQHAPDLVHRGLLAAYLEAAGRAGESTR